MVYDFIVFIILNYKFFASKNPVFNRLYYQDTCLFCRTKILLDITGLKNKSIGCVSIEIVRLD